MSVGESPVQPTICKLKPDILKIPSSEGVFISCSYLRVCYTRVIIMKETLAQIRLCRGLFLFEL